MRKLVWMFVFISSGAFGASCPDGYVPVAWPANIKLSAACDSNTIDLGVVATEGDDVSETCTLGLLCGAKRKIMTSDGGEATLYSNMHTNPAIHLNFGDETCYANLAAGQSGDGLRVQKDNELYHTADLHQCRVKVNANTSYSVDTPDNNSVSWFGQIGGVDFTAWALCSSDWGTSGTTKSHTGVSTTTSENQYCYCRMVVPVVSVWVFATSYSGGSICETSCAKACATTFSDNATFRNTIISGISTN